jgi:hypothetical protein
MVNNYKEVEKTLECITNQDPGLALALDEESVTNTVPSRLLQLLLSFPDVLAIPFSLVVSKFPDESDELHTACVVLEVLGAIERTEEDDLQLNRQQLNIIANLPKLLDALEQLQFDRKELYNIFYRWETDPTQKE